MFFDDCLGEKETQANAFALGGEEGFEDMFDHLRVDALAGVGKSHKKFAVVADEADIEATAVGHRLSRIGDNVNEAQAQLFGVDVEHRRYVAALLDDLDALAFELRFGEREYAVYELVEGQADEVERILDFMRERAGELSESGKAFEPVELELTLARPAKLRQHVIEAAGQKADLIVPSGLGYWFETARGDVLRRIGDRENRIHVALGQDIGEGCADREDHETEGEQAHPVVAQRLVEVAEIGNHLYVAEHMILDLDRYEVDDTFLVGQSQLRGGHGHGAARVVMKLRREGAYDVAIEGGADELGVRAVDDEVLARGDRDFESLGIQLADVMLELVAVGRSNRGQFLHAYLDGAGEIFDVFLSSADDRFLRAQAHDHFGAQSQPQQHNHQGDQLRFETEGRKFDIHGLFRPPVRGQLLIPRARPACN